MTDEGIQILGGMGYMKVTASGGEGCPGRPLLLGTERLPVLPAGDGSGASAARPEDLPHLRGHQ